MDKGLKSPANGGYDKMFFKIRKKLSWAVVFSALFLICACPGSSGSDSNDTYPTGFMLEVTLGGGEPEVNVTPPSETGESYFGRAGVTLDSETHNVRVESTSANQAGEKLEITLEVTNENSAVLQRVWLIVKSLDENVVVDSSSADGYIGDGIYYFLGNIGTGSSATATVVFDVPSQATSFAVVSDVVSVRDRIVFQFIPGGNSEVWTVDMDGGDLFRVVEIESPDFSFVPVYSPDGGWIAFAWGHPNYADIGLVRADGKDAIRLTCFDDYSYPGGFTPDGKKLFILHYEETLGTADIYLLDIAMAKEDCSSNASLTPMTVSTSEPVFESLPLAAPDGSFIVFGRKPYKYAEPPYPLGDPNPTCCPGWAHGSELKYLSFDLYLMPTDPVTGLPTGPEVLFWEDSLLWGIPTIAPDSRGVIVKAGGCANYRYYCNASCQWYLDCEAWVPPADAAYPGKAGLHRLEIPSNWSSLPYNYADNPGSHTYFPGMENSDFNPYWGWQSDRVVFTDSDDNISDCDPFNCAVDRRLLNDAPGQKVGPKFTPAVVDP